LEFPGHRFPKEFASLIYNKTEGSPLFIADVVRYLRDRKVIGEQEGSWTLVQTVPEIENDLPETVRSMIQRKIAQLSEEDRRLLVAASAQGYNFDSAVVAQALGMDPAEVEERLQSLDKEYGFVRYRKEDEFPDHTLTLKYRFVHVLYQNDLYASLTPSRRASLSATTAKALLGFYGKESSAAASELAFLFQAARDWSQASDYFLKAARNAARIFANQEAITLCRRGLEMARRLPDSPERDRQELKLQITLGPSLMTVKGFAAADTLQTFLRARDLCERLGDEAQLFRVVFGLAIVLVVRGEYEKAGHFAQQCLRLAERSEDAALLVQAHWVLGLTIQFLGQLVGAREHLERSLALYDPQRHAAHVFLYGAILNRMHLGRVLLYLGYADQAQLMVQEGLRVAEKIGHPLGLCNALSVAITIEAFHRNTETMMEMAEKIFFHSEEHGLPYYRAIAGIMQGWARAMRGDVDEGLAEVREGLAAHRSVETEQQRASYLVLLAEALSRADRVEEGLHALGEALEKINNMGERLYEAEFYRIKGELLARGEESDAEACFREAIEVARRQGAKAFELRAVTGLARLWQRQGRQQEAREMLEPIYGWFTEGFDTPDLEEARALLAELRG
jgi:predicted ATPase